MKIKQRTSKTLIARTIASKYNVSRGLWEDKNNLVPPIPLPTNFTIGASKLIPNNEGYFLGGIDGDTTQHLKVEAEAPFTRVRVRFYCKVAGAGTLKLAVAPTSAKGVSNDDDRYNPINEVGSVDTSLWVQGLYSGSPVGTIKDGATDDVSITVSDWIDLESFTPDTGERPYLLAKLNINGSGFVVATSSAMDSWRSGSGETYYRLFDKGSVSGDSTESPTTIPTGAYSGGMHWISFEFDYGIDTNTIMAAGDSITAGGGGQFDAFGQWTLLAANNISTPAKPWNSHNIGMSGRSSTQYMRALENELDALNGDLMPKYVTIPAFTPNDGAPDQSSSDLRILKIISACEKCAALGIKPIVWTGLPVDGYGSDTWRVYANDWAKDETNQSTYGFALIDYDALVGSGANPNRFKEGFTTDGIHPSGTAIVAMSEALSSKIVELEA